jgi:hypothetical protein
MERVYRVCRLFNCFILVVLLTSDAFADRVGIFYDNTVPQSEFAAKDIQTALQGKNHTAELKGLSALSADYPHRRIVLGLVGDSMVGSLLKAQGGIAASGLGEQAYALRTTTQGKPCYWVLGGDLNGLMYGGLQ